MAKGYGNVVSGSISSNTNTTLVTPASNESVYVIYASVDVTAAGTTSTAQFVEGAGGTPFSTFLTTAVGHQEAYYGTGAAEAHAGYKLPPGTALVLTTAGGAAATLRATVIYRIV